MKKPATAQERKHLARVAALGCLICGCQAEIHHIRARGSMGKRSSHFETISLCPRHHRTGGHGVAIHAGQKTFEAKYGTEEELLDRVNWLLKEPAV